MNKMEFIESVAEEAGLSKKDALAAVEAFEKVVTRTLANDGEVSVTGFGTFMVSHRKPREGVNPQNPTERIQIPAVNIPKFKAGKTLKDALK